MEEEIAQTPLQDHKPVEFSEALPVGQVYNEEDELDEDAYIQDYKVVQKTLVTYTCMPKKIIILMMVIGSVLALLALCIAIYFMFFRYLLGKEIAEYVTVIVTRPTPSFGSPPSPTVPGISSSTTQAGWRCPEPDDLQPALCQIAAQQGLCNTQFGQSQCCRSCPVDPGCYDQYPGCFKVLLYGSCVDPVMNQTCCASCAP